MCAQPQVPSAGHPRDHHTNHARHRDDNAQLDVWPQCPHRHEQADSPARRPSRRARRVAWTAGPACCGARLQWRRVDAAPGRPAAPLLPQDPAPTATSSDAPATPARESVGARASTRVDLEGSHGAGRCRAGAPHHGEVSDSLSRARRGEALKDAQAEHRPCPILGAVVSTCAACHANRA